MLFNLRSIVLFSSAIAASVLAGLVAIVPVPAAPVVTPALLLAVAPDVAPEPDDWAVPALLVPGAAGSCAELPAPLGSLAELFRPPAFAGPGGMPLTPEGPAPAEPALGEPVALDDPVALLLPALAPPALPPLCANEMAGMVRMASAAIAAVMVDLVMGSSLYCPTTPRGCRSLAERFRPEIIEQASAAMQEPMTLA
jgi:hypothetical protein